MFKVGLFFLVNIFSVAGFSANKCSALFETTYTEDQIIEAAGKTKDYEDKRNEEWLDKQKCLCCHTTLPYVLNRAVDTKSKNNMDRLRAMAELSVENPARDPWYSSDNAGRNSKPTEAVMNAMTLVMNDVSSQAPLSSISKKSLDQIFDHLDPSGTIHWLDYALQPFESKESEGWGNAMAILTVEIAKKKHHYAPPVEKYTALKKALLNDPSKLNPHEMSVLLWAHSHNKSVLSASLKQTFIAEISKQQKADGSWSQKSVLGMGTDAPSAYATAMATIGLISAGKANTSLVKNGVDWLIQNGGTSYSSISMNRPNSRLNNTFATDFATSYSSLALSLYNEKKAP